MASNSTLGCFLKMNEYNSCRVHSRNAGSCFLVSDLWSVHSGQIVCLHETFTVSREKNPVSSWGSHFLQWRAQQVEVGAAFGSLIKLSVCDSMKFGRYCYCSHISFPEWLISRKLLLILVHAEASITLEICPEATALSVLA